jgi:hypothetical protein
MKVTKEQKVYLGLLALGLVAFVLDRTVFTPSAADASDSSDLLVAKSPAAALAPHPATATVSNPLGVKLLGLSESLHLSDAKPRDAFTPAQEWVGKPQTAAADNRTFEQTHRLEAVMVGRRPAAMIDGTLVHLGEAMDGFTLVAVSQGCATLQQGETTVALRNR